jgi:hypothetical protein
VRSLFESASYSAHVPNDQDGRRIVAFVAHVDDTQAPIGAERDRVAGFQTPSLTSAGSAGVPCSNSKIKVITDNAGRLACLSSGPR